MKVLSSLVLIVTAFFLGFFITESSSCSAFGLQSATVSAAEFSRRLSACHPRVLDVRTAAEFAAGHLAGADNADYNQTAQFSLYLDSLPRDATYFIYCRTGHRSGLAARLMADKGFKSVINLDGGITAWTAAGLPVVK